MFAGLDPKVLRRSELYRVEEVPEHFHEKFIVKGYRSPKSTPFQCVLSLFDATNETLNFWTHFLPSWYFMWVLKGLSDTLDFQNDSYLWPLLSYLCMSCMFPLASSTAHTFNTMSVAARHICFFLDYSAISLQGLCVAVAYRAYAFPSVLRHTVVGELYIPIAVFNTFVCVVISCWTRFMGPSTLRKVLRLGAFALPCFYDIAPIVYRLAFGTDEEMRLLSWTHHFWGISLMFLSGFLYGTHFPERLFPGSFDIVGHSHQLFHMCTIIGTMAQMQAMLNDMQERRDTLEPSWEFESLGDSVGLVAVVMAINTAIVLIYSYKLYHNPRVKTA